MVDKHRPEDREQSDADPATFEGVSFGEVRYAMHKQRNFTVANTGRVPATVGFIDRPVGPGQVAGIAPTWLTLKSEDGVKITANNAKRTLQPGDTFSVEIELRILDVHQARAFNEGIEQMEDILVLRVENGRDHFVPLRGIWLESSLGHSISKLIRIPEGGIRKLQRQRPDSSKSNESSTGSDPVKWSAPRELFRLTEAVEDLTIKSVAEWSMVSGDEGQSPWEKVAGWPFAEESWISTDSNERSNRLADVCDALDHDSAFDQALPATLSHLQRLESLASFLLLFLEGMPDGVVPEDLWAQIESAMIKNEKEKRPGPTEEEQRTWTQEVLSQSPSHSISFILLCAMLDRIVSEVASAHNALQSEKQNQPEIASYIRAGAILRRKTLSKDPAVAYRQVLVRAMAATFAPLIIRAPVPGKDKEKAVLEDRKMRIIELFLSKD